ncbi:citrate synthase family protein [Arvimicrobium flavum]|uniref:citrate synthase family protein n=1 Tax=Arvimicrobium flavum TaxID=3393320 RepID=UPI00237AB410|nr:citrate synthase family protein [Mesorhizobium shangrilense]
MKNPRDPLYLTARQAAGELSVSPATLYAYVSRGLIRSEPAESSRERRYRAEDVRALKGRRSMPAAQRSDVEQQAIETAVSTIDDGGQIYRGVRAVPLAAEASLEQAATLLWDVSGIDPFEPGNLPVMDQAMRAVMDACAQADPLPRAIATLALATSADGQAFNRSAEGRARIGARIVRLVTTAILGTPASADPVHVQIARQWAEGERQAESLIRRALVLLADHEFNPSTYTLRCAVSTGLSLYDATVAGLVALKGPKHGGAALLAAQFVGVLAVAEGDLEQVVRTHVTLGEQIPGFGHKVYRSSDPRADDLLAALVRAGADRRLAVEAPALISDATGLFPNIDYALAVMARTLGLPPGAEIALFAIARTAGWIAHGAEQLASGKLIRPAARYVGLHAGRTGRHPE